MLQIQTQSKVSVPNTLMHDGSHVWHIKSQTAQFTNYVHTPHMATIAYMSEGGKYCIHDHTFSLARNC